MMTINKNYEIEKIQILTYTTENPTPRTIKWCGF